MLLTWNASSSIIKQNDRKNKTTWLNQTALSKYFLYFISLTLKNFSKDIIFFVQNLFHIKRFSNEIVWKLSKNVELKIANDPKIG